MKKLIILSFLLTIVQGTVLSQFNGSCLPEGITFTTQEQIDSFQVNYPGCTEIEGNVTICDGCDEYTVNIKNLNGLSILTSIGGDLEFSANDSLESLTGIEGLTSIAGSLRIGCWNDCNWSAPNQRLVDINGLKNLTSVGGSICITNNESLISLAGLENLTFIGGDLKITGNYALASIEALEGLTNIPGSLILGTYVDIGAYDGNGFASLSGLNNLTSVGGDFYILGYTHLKDLQGLENLKSIGGHLVIHDNAELTSLSGLNHLESAGGVVLGTWDSRDSIKSLSGLENLSFIEENLVIEEQKSLKDLDGLEKLHYIGGDIIIMGNDSLLSLDGFSSLDTVGGSVQIGIDYGYNEPNPLLTSVSALSGLKFIGEDLIIQHNPALTNLTGLENILSVNNLMLRNNSALTSLSGLGGLTNIEGNLTLSNNGSLTSISDIENLSFIGGDLWINDNQALTNCAAQGICSYLDMPNGSVNIYNNATGCDNPVEIANNCGISLPCLPYGNYYFITQAEIDGFEANYPECGLLEGDVIIKGDDIVNLDGLSGINSISGGLSISGNISLASVSGLNNLITIGGNLEIKSDTNLQSLSGLENLSFLGGNLLLQDNPSIDDLQGLAGLDSIGGRLLIYNLDALTSLSGLDGLSSIGSDININGNGSLLSLNGLENLKPETIQLLRLVYNPLLSSCEVISICNYLANPSGEIIIFNNAPGCNSPEEVEAACLAGVQSSVVSRQSVVDCYPNPTQGISYFTLHISQYQWISLKIYNAQGQEVATVVDGEWSGDKVVRWDMSRLPAGVYYYRLMVGGQRSAVGGQRSAVGGQQSAVGKIVKY